MSDSFTQFEAFPWNQNFETGIPLIDEQHQVLVTLLNNLANSLITPDIPVINAAFDELANYAVSHFEQEELIWTECFGDDNWVSSHQMAHAAFLPTIMEIKKEYRGDALSGITEQIVKYLIRWLTFHILDNDKRMAFAVLAHKSGASFDEAKQIADKKMSGSMRVLIETILSMYDVLSSRTIELLREMDARRKAEQDLKEIYQSLKLAHDEVRTLQGIIPICSYCHRIRDDEGMWDRVEAYITKHSDAKFSHGVCPVCLVRVLKNEGLD